MAELADALGSGPSGRKVVEVRVLLSAPKSAVSSQLSALSSRFPVLGEGVDAEKADRCKRYFPR